MLLLTYLVYLECILASRIKGVTTQSHTLVLLLSRCGRLFCLKIMRNDSCGELQRLTPEAILRHDDSLPVTTLSYTAAAAAAAMSSPPKWCQPGHSAFPSCLVGVHTVQHIGGEQQARLSLGIGSNAGSGTGFDGGGRAGGGALLSSRICLEYVQICFLNQVGTSLNVMSWNDCFLKVCCVSFVLP